MQRFFRALMVNQLIFFNKERGKMNTYFGVIIWIIWHYLISKGYIKRGIKEFDYLKNNGKTYRSKKTKDPISNTIKKDMKNRVGYMID